jgi:hypothetical protein
MRIRANITNRFSILGEGSKETFFPTGTCYSRSVTRLETALDHDLIASSSSALPICPCKTPTTVVVEAFFAQTDR